VNFVAIAAATAASRAGMAEKKKKEKTYEEMFQYYMFALDRSALYRRKFTRAALQQRSGEFRRNCRGNGCFKRGNG